MLRSLRFCCAVLLSVALFAGCCANNSCDCQDSRADAFYFRFQLMDVVGASGFERSEVDTVAILRYPIPLSVAPQAAHDSTTFIRSEAEAGDSIILNNNAPFSAGSNRKLDSFEYIILIRDRNRQLQRFIVRNIRLKGRFEPDGCCTCYQNSEKYAEVNGRPFTVTETDQQPVIIPLTR
jgi:hypothetical protein